MHFLQKNRALEVPNLFISGKNYPLLTHLLTSLSPNLELSKSVGFSHFFVEKNYWSDAHQADSDLYIHNRLSVISRFRAPDFLRKITLEFSDVLF